jgi:predicted N-acetyltransferase YhbS
MTRIASPRDAAALREIWESAFFDSDEEISDFFDSFGGRASSVIAEDEGGRAVAAGHIAAVGDLALPGGRRMPCAMLYAIAALPGARGLGHGAEVTRALTRAAADLGYPAVVLRPADDGLFEYYSRRAGFREWFYAREQTYRAGQLPRSQSARARPLAPEEYRAARERLLSGAAHIDMDEHALEYQRKLCDRSGGGMFELKIGPATACAIAERTPSGALIARELLTPSADTAPFASALLNILPSKTLTAFSPAHQTAPAHRFGMINAPHSLHPSPPPWYGPSFD